jgi:Lar family restriction alleviation protein
LEGETKMEIKKCPFCGGSARFYAYDPFDGYQGNLTTYRVECTKCRANIKNTNGVNAIEAWNRRVDDGRED